MTKPLKISEQAAVQMPMKTVASLIIIVALGTMGYFQMIERLNIADTRIQIMEKDVSSSEDNGAQVRHPVLGPIVILVASKPIAKEEEVTAQNNVIVPLILFC